MEIEESVREIKKALEWWEAGLVNKAEFYSMIWKASGALDKAEVVQVQSHCSNSNLLASSGVYVVEAEYRRPTQEEWDKSVAFVKKIQEEVADAAIQKQRDEDWADDCRYDMRR